MSGFGSSGQGLQWRLRGRMGQRIIDLHPLRLVPVVGAHHHQALRVTLLPPMGTRYHTSLHHLNHQWSCGTIAHVDPPPGCLVERRPPLGNAVPGTLWPAPPAAGLRERRFQSTPRRVRRHGQQRPLAHSGQPPPQPLGTPHLVVTGQPAMGPRGTVLCPQLHRQLVPSAIAAVGFGPTGFVPARLLLGPCLGKG